ncbi:hypothetical protein MAM1_0161d06947 [Mucor ambiguus]|uniref:Uncharacterized protein n=1 Tax=Mucor ambiguus TaxID=91626 RepID=A0A0C9LVV8_9FUNG|nr:hypothetical protein MAM1_0161d06947 [Mucor ambiguus]
MSVIDITDNRFWFASVDTTKKLMIQVITSMWNDIFKDASSSVKSKKRAEQLLKSIVLVVNSRPTEMVINNNIKKQSKELLKNRLVQEELDELTSHGTPTTSAADPQETPTPARKKRKYLKPRDLRTLPFTEQVKLLSSYYGKQNELDLTRNNAIPRRFKQSMNDICCHFNIQLGLMLLDSEHHVIKEISKCRTKEALYKSVNYIDPFTNQSELPYIKLATQKLCHLLFANVLQAEHNEVWYRANVYGDIFDYIFSVKSGYEAKRSECHSNIVKSLKVMNLLPPEQKNVKLDFIFFHTATRNDGLVCEDKPTDTESSKDCKKVKDLREKALLYCKLKLTIGASKLIDEVMIHSTLKSVTVPSDEHDGASWAEYLSAVISLVRLVMYNLDVIRLMTDIAKEDGIDFASTTPIMNSQFREDSPESDDSNHSTDLISDSTESKNNTHWEDKERKLRILEKIDIALTNFNEEKDDFYVNPSWEDIYFKEQVTNNDEE